MGKGNKVKQGNGELSGSEERGEIPMLIGVRVDLIGKGIFEHKLKGRR